MIAYAELKKHLGSLDLDVDIDAESVITDIESRAVDFIQRETGRHFGEETSFTEYFDGRDTQVLDLNESPDEITSVHERCEIGDDWDEIVEGDSDGFELRGSELLRKGGCLWEKGYEYRVIYPFGYTPGNEPGEIRQLVMDLVALRWRQRGLEGHSTGRIGDYAFTLSDIQAIPGAEETIDRWRWQTVA